MHELTERNTAPDAGPSADRNPWTILVLLCAAQFMVILDVTVVNVALPSIGRTLGFAAADLQWVVTAYVLMTGGLLLLGGRVADLLGSRIVFLAGLIVFTGASLASGLAPTPGALIASRAVQGLGAALLSPAALSIVTTTYTGEQRTAALSVWGAIGAGGAAAGVLLGGVLTTWLSWEWVFFINVPVGIATALLALRVLPAVRVGAGSLSELDLPGALTIVSGLALLIYAIQGTTSHGWGSTRTLVLLAVGGGLLSAFAAIERRARQPLIPISTWRVRSLVSSATVMLGSTGILVGTFFLNSLLLQNVIHASALETGLAFLPLVIVIGIAAHIGPHLLTHVGARAVVVGGLTLIAGGDLLLAGAGAHAAYASDLLPGFVLLGFGVGLTFIAISVTAMSEVPADRAGVASGLMTTAHELGGAFGVAIFATVALGAGATGAGFVSGYGDGALTAALIAAALALVALVAVPAVRPATAQQVALH
jgi:EmrB/QacA subfamily drug resistance transporter